MLKECNAVNGNRPTPVQRKLLAVNGHKPLSTILLKQPPKSVV